MILDLLVKFGVLAIVIHAEKSQMMYRKMQAQSYGLNGYHLALAHPLYLSNSIVREVGKANYSSYRKGPV